MALAGELVGVGGHFLFLGLALVSKDWRFLQRMITAPCILFLFYGSVSSSASCLAIPIFPSSIALAWRPLLFPTVPRPGLLQPQPLRGGSCPSLGQQRGGLTVYPLPPPSWPGLFLESARWLIVKRQIEEAQSVLRILAERNRPHGQMLGEEAQEALQGKTGVPPGNTLCMHTTVPSVVVVLPFPRVPTTHVGGRWVLSWSF